MLDSKQYQGQNTITTKDSSPWLFFSLAFGWSWLLWILAVLFGHTGYAFLATSLHFVSGLGPLLAAITLVYREQDQKIRRDYWRRVIELVTGM